METDPRNSHINTSTAQKNQLWGGIRVMQTGNYSYLTATGQNTQTELKEFLKESNIKL
jgi:hypothetical protein